MIITIIDVIKDKKAEMSYSEDHRKKATMNLAGLWKDHNDEVSVEDTVRAMRKGLYMDYRIKMLWDNEASVWIATSDDVPGLILESGSFDALIERVRFAIPELLELNSRKAPFYNITFLSERHDMVTVNG